VISVAVEGIISPLLGFILFIKMLKIIFIPTWRCNLKCAYCDYEVKKIQGTGYLFRAFDRIHSVDRELNWYEWLAYLERFEPYLLEMTGGEPLMYKNLDKLTRHLPHHSRWAITSNTLNRELIKKLPEHNCLSWTASYQFCEDDRFISNLFLLKIKGLKPRVTVVITPQNHQFAFKKIKWLTDLGYCVNIHPVLKKDFSWQEQMDIWDKAKAFADGDRIRFIDDISYRWVEHRYDFCEAGKNYFMLLPDGRVLRCYSQILTEKDLGYIWNFAPHSIMMPCNMGCVFPCDRQVRKEASYDKRKVLV